MSLARSPMNINFNRTRVDSAVRSEYRPIQNAIGKENSKGVLIESWKLQMNDLMSKVNDIPISISLDSRSNAAPLRVREKTSLDVVRNLPRSPAPTRTMIQPATNENVKTVTKPSDFLRIEEIMDAFRENPHAAESAVLLACKSGKLFPSEFRRILEVLRSPSPARDAVVEDVYSPFGTKITVDSKISSRLDMPKYSALNFNSVEDGFSSNFVNPATAPSTSISTLLQVLGDDDIVTENESKIFSLSSADDAAPSPAAKATVEVIGGHKLQRTPIAKATLGSARKSSSKKILKTVSLAKYYDENENTVTDSAPVAQSSLSVPTENPSATANPFQGRKLVRTPPKIVSTATTLSLSEHDVATATVASQSKPGPEQSETLAEGAMEHHETVLATDLSAVDVEPSLGEIMRAADNSTDVERSSASLEKKDSVYSREELAFVSTVIRRASLTVAQSTDLSFDEENNESSAENQQEATNTLEFLQAEVSRLQSALLVRDAAPVSIPPSQLSVYSHIDNDIALVRQREIELAREQVLIREAYNLRLNRIALLKADLTQQELKRAAGLRKQRLSIRKSDPTIFDRSYQADERHEGPENGLVEQFVTANYSPSTRPMAPCFQVLDVSLNGGSSVSPSNFPPLMSDGAQFVPVCEDSSTFRFAVPAVKRPIATIYGDPRLLSLVYAGRAPPALDLTSSSSRAPSTKVSAFRVFQRHAASEMAICEPCQYSTTATEMISQPDSEMVTSSPIQSPCTAPTDQSHYSPLIETFPENENSIVLDNSQFEHASRLIEAEGNMMVKEAQKSTHVELKKRKIDKFEESASIIASDKSTRYGSRWRLVPLTQQLSSDLVEPIELDVFETEPISKHMYSKKHKVIDEIETKSISEKIEPEEAAKGKKGKKAPVKPLKSETTDKKVTKAAKSEVAKEIVKCKSPIADKQGIEAITVSTEDPILSAAVSIKSFTGVDQTNEKKIRAKRSRATAELVEDIAIDSVQQNVVAPVEPAVATKPKAATTTGRPKSGYVIFCEHQMPMLRSQNALSSELDLVNMCSSQWKKLTQAEKTQWNTCAKAASIPENTSVAQESTSPSMVCASATSCSPAKDDTSRITRSAKKTSAASEIVHEQQGVDDDELLFFTGTKQKGTKNKKSQSKKIVQVAEVESTVPEPKSKSKRVNDEVLEVVAKLDQVVRDADLKRPVTKKAKKTRGEMEVDGTEAKLSLEIPSGTSISRIATEKSKVVSEPVISTSGSTVTQISVPVSNSMPAPVSKPKATGSQPSAAASAALFKAQDLLNSSAMSNNSSISKPTAKFMLPKLLKKR